MSETAGDPFARYKLGEVIGASEWTTITQPMIDQFGALTLDPDPMHIDPAWARANGPFGGAIAFGFLTVSMLTHFLHDAMGDDSSRPRANAGFYLNYGFNRLRLVTPVPADSRLRGHFTLLERRPDARGRFISSIAVELQIEGAERPALVAEWLAMWVPAGAKLN